MRAGAERVAALPWSFGRRVLGRIAELRPHWQPAPDAPRECRVLLGLALGRAADLGRKYARGGRASAAQAADLAEAGPSVGATWGILLALARRAWRHTGRVSVLSLGGPQPRFRHSRQAWQPALVEAQQVMVGRRPSSPRDSERQKCSTSRVALRLRSLTTAPLRVIGQPVHLVGARGRDQGQG